MLVRARDVTQTSVLRVDRIEGQPQGSHVRWSQTEIEIVLVRRCAMVSRWRFVEPLGFLSVTLFTIQINGQFLPLRLFAIRLEERIAAHVLQLFQSLRPGTVLIERGRVRESRDNITDVPIQFAAQFDEVCFRKEIADDDKAVAVKVELVL